MVLHSSEMCAAVQQHFLHKPLNKTSALWCPSQVAPFRTAVYISKGDELVIFDKCRKRRSDLKGCHCWSAKRWDRNTDHLWETSYPSLFFTLLIFFCLTRSEDPYPPVDVPAPRERKRKNPHQIICRRKLIKLTREGKKARIVPPAERPWLCPFAARCLKNWKSVIDFL